MAEMPAVTADAIRRIYAERYRSCYRLALTITGSEASAHDAVQEGFALALSRRQQLRDERALEAWIYRIVARCALETRRNGHATAPADLPEDVTLVWSPELPRPERDPELARALSTLAPRQRLVIFLRFFADLPIATIAQVCGISEGTVSATLAQAKAVLLSRLGSGDARSKGERSPR
jgi:RNA polymerase sigma-70 factor, ECF subfamily